jgi:hypothetical protein
MKRQTVRKLAAVCAALMALGACSKSPQPTVTRIASTGHVSFEKPTPNQQVPAGRVEVKVVLTGATLSKVVTTNITPGVGHMHLKLDGRTVSILAGLDEILNDIVDPATGKKIGPLSKGPHLITAELVASDHGPFDPDVNAAVNIVAV